ncbi:MAG: hypothetical protein ACT4PV_11100 [Planctomycetaceae bacterium]
MIDRLLLVATAALFAYLVAGHHWVAARMVAAEKAAFARMSVLALAGPAQEVREGAYRFHWLEAEGIPPLLVAEPERQGIDAVRIFATLDGKRIYEFDPVTSRTRDDRPELEKLHLHLTLPEREGARRLRLPSSWVPADRRNGG